MKVGIKMSLLRRNNDIEFYAVPNQHWVISAEYPFYKDLEKLFDFTNEDISKGSCTVQGLQKPILNKEWEKEREEYKKWFLSIFKQMDMPITKIHDRQEEPEHKAWTINYFPGGWQAGHFHSTNKINQANKRFASSVIFFDELTPTKRNPFNGCLYTVMQDPNGYSYDHKFHPAPGKVVVMDDRVWHGAYPCEDNRRCLVWDFDIE